MYAKCALWLKLLFYASNQIPMDIKLVLVNECTFNYIVEEIRYLDPILSGDKSPPAVRRARRFSKIGILKGRKLAGDPIIVATYNVNGLSIMFRELLVIHRSVSGKLMVFKSRCRTCMGCPLLTACTSVIKDVANELSIEGLRGLTPKELATDMINKLLQESKGINAMVSMRQSPQVHMDKYDGKIRIIERASNSV